ncbi:MULTISPECIES: PD-(D/E)XK nuclease-like domain-containing protein [unclassified Aurantimonas]|uniref:PD-(D/E)XK nuclease-like domain-containing protein n=1 Tax=unclassified Aurantimonas TaxID=2638230 RepID=UPI002E1709E2|nr:MULTISPECIES: PD-(D/E)XK nuclease-like domain-containing protein [unclassified Aurantimonas]MEC5289439.1 PD-(D/E)XK nuclease-like domain-containing protein [Aurantimonas sp. C2-3-R2]MEC5410519.1 PD-(D/E)XK nuclease-like domain-containing protein [Aurantimonas sp. C2-4-R8]
MNAEIEFQGGKITQPGIYRGVPMEAYHGALCAGPSISSSGLRAIENKSPLHYWASSYLNPDRPEEEDKPHFELGRAVHTLLLSEQGFNDQFVTSPFPDYRTKEARQWRDDTRAGGKSIITEKQKADILGMADRLMGDTVALDLLRGRVERSIVWQDPATQAWVKARPDALPADSIIADLKTCSDASEVKVSRSIMDFGYLQQMALAIEGMKRVGGGKIDEAVLLFIETTYPYGYNIKPLDQGDVYLAMRQNRRALDTFAACLAAGDWPTYPTSTFTFSAPLWWSKRLNDDPALPENREAA